MAVIQIFYVHLSSGGRQFHGNASWLQGCFLAYRLEVGRALGVRGLGLRAQLGIEGGVCNFASFIHRLGVGRPWECEDWGYAPDWVLKEAHVIVQVLFTGWEWDGPWECEDWGYAPDWSALTYPLTPSSRAKNAADFVRRRRWVRRRRRQQQQEAPGVCCQLPCHRPMLHLA